MLPGSPTPGKKGWAALLGATACWKNATRPARTSPPIRCTIFAWPFAAAVPWPMVFTPSIPIPNGRQMKKLGKPLFSSLGELRDTQVMSEWVTRLSEASDSVRHSFWHSLAHKETDTKLAAQEALANFDRKRWLALNTKLAKRTDRVPLEGLVFQHLALERWMEAHELHRQALRNRTQVGYHQLRIGIKRFRYTVENFLPQRHEKWAQDLRDLQDALGEVHDFDVLRGIDPSASGDSGRRPGTLVSESCEERQKRLDFYRAQNAGQEFAVAGVACGTAQRAQRWKRRRWRSCGRGRRFWIPTATLRLRHADRTATLRQLSRTSRLVSASRSIAAFWRLPDSA